MKQNRFNALKFGPLALLLIACSSTKDPNVPRSLVERPKTEEEVMLANASNTYDQGLFSISEDNWTQLRDGFPASYYGPLAELKIADAQYFRGDYAAALASYDEFARIHPGHEALPYIRFQIANCHIEQYQGRQYDQTPLHSALKVYQELINEFPDSEYVIFARRNMDRGRQLLAEHEVFVAEYYERRGVEKAAENRKRVLYTLYPDSAAALRDDHSGVAGTQVTLSDQRKQELQPVQPTMISGSARATLVRSTLPAPTIDPISPPAPVRSAIVENELAQTQSNALAFVREMECGEQDDGSTVFIAYLTSQTSGAAVSGKKLTVTIDGVSEEADSVATSIECVTDLLTLKLQPDFATQADGTRALEFELSKNREVLELRVVTLDRPNRVVLFAKKKGSNPSK